MAEIDEPSIRRNLQQIKHCVTEAESILMADEEDHFAIEDLRQAQELIAIVIRRMKTRAALRKPK